MLSIGSEPGVDPCPKTKLPSRKSGRLSDRAPHGRCQGTGLILRQLGPGRPFRNEDRQYRLGFGLDPGAILGFTISTWRRFVFCWIRGGA